MGAASRNRMFPVGLYATLLVGLVGITVPELVAPAEVAARTVVTLPLRAYAILFNEHPALAATGESTFGDELFAAQAKAALAGAKGPNGPSRYVPIVCRVRARRGRPSGPVDELVLDCRPDVARGCAPLVTAGRGLLGFLDPGTPKDPGGTVRVRLLHYRERFCDPRRALRVGSPHRPLRIAAKVECREALARGDLHFLVEPARRNDRWPLRCTMLDDAYLASRLRHSGDIVTTIADPEHPSVPAGLHVGRLMIWGYPQRDIPVGLFVEPVAAPEAISCVVLWRKDSEPPVSATALARLRPDRAGRFVPVLLSSFPGPRPARRRWVVTSAAGTPLPEGAALVDRGRLLGLLHKPWSGQSLVTPFAGSGRTWSFLLLPASGTNDGKAIELVGKVSGRAFDGRVRVRRIAPDSPFSVVAGDLYTGANGPHCPAGLRIGPVQPLGRDLLVTLARGPVPRPEVFLGHEGPR